MSDVSTQELVIFEMAGHDFAMDLSIVEEVLPASPVTPIPKSPSFLLGIAGVRGKVVSVINGAARYGIAPTLCSHFMLCKVRDSLTAVAVDRPLMAGALIVRKLDVAEREKLLKEIGVHEKFLQDAYELIEETKEKKLIPTGRKFFSVNADLFVSNEMASQVGEA